MSRDRTGDPGDPVRPEDDGVRLTVVIACLNSADTIGEQLEALAGQECPVPWELLICDNGSTDDTARVVRDAARRDPHLPVTWLDASALPGPGAARNVGARRARGRWLAFCDADDVVADGWLQAMCEALDRCVFVGGRFDGSRLNSPRALRSRPLDQQEGLQFSPGVTDLPHAGAGNMGIHTDVFRRVGGFDPAIRWLEDTELSWRVQLREGIRLQYVPAAVVHVRLRARHRAMYRQGLAYGAAYAVLECRFGGGGPRRPDAPDATVSPGSPTESSRARGAWAQLVAWLGPQPSVGRLIWQVGWHRGHRRRLTALLAAQDGAAAGPAEVDLRALESGDLDHAARGHAADVPPIEQRSGHTE